eukprot:gb/GECG01013789.1/.p1 GENE.gb/GECG01013789.1/~~gb/GECG01013789.1/.p1  ORF type:complete len:167 (+),score=6.17 gb/GECG01013789.1/:1-501(+)
MCNRCSFYRGYNDTAVNRWIHSRNTARSRRHGARRVRTCYRNRSDTNYQGYWSKSKPQKHLGKMLYRVATTDSEFLKGRNTNLSFDFGGIARSDSYRIPYWLVHILYRIWQRLFGKEEMRILMVGLDAAGKTTILYKLKLGEVVTTIPTIGRSALTLSGQSGYKYA